CRPFPIERLSFGAHINDTLNSHIFNHLPHLRCTFYLTHYEITTSKANVCYVTELADHHPKMT
ncbi:MAG: hypothetical protein IJV69_08020, partial [Kiritimatiellae bacterium]|nr:hypothetical protein [Kiritimatiellia bacterium]